MLQPQREFLEPHGVSSFHFVASRAIFWPAELNACFNTAGRTVPSITERDAKSITAPEPSLASTSKCGGWWSPAHMVSLHFGNRISVAMRNRSAMVAPLAMQPVMATVRGDHYFGRRVAKVIGGWHRPKTEPLLRLVPIQN